MLLQVGARSRSRVQSDRGSDKVEARNSAHSELSPSLADSDPSGGKAAAAPAKERGTHTRIFSISSLSILTTFTGGKGKKAAKKPDTGKARQKGQSSASDNKGKRKALADGDGSEVVEDANDKKTTKPRKTKAQKSQTTAKESHPTDVGNDDDDDDTENAAVSKKKKMRKLNVNIFGSSKADSLDWANQFNLVSSHIAVRILSYDYVC